MRAPATPSKRKLILPRMTLRVLEHEVSSAAAENTKNGNTCAAPCRTGLALAMR